MPRFAWAVRPEDLRRSLLDHQPEIVHFSGHGKGDQGLVLEDDNGQLQLVSTESQGRLFRLFQEKIECVLLNACYSEAQAEAIHQHINYVVGMNQAVGDRAAIKFAVGFYDALGAGRCLQAGKPVRAQWLLNSFSFRLTGRRGDAGTPRVWNNK